MNRKQLLQKCESIIIEKLAENEVVALHVETGVFAALNRVSMYILNYLEEPHTIFEIVAYINDMLECESDIMDDVQSFVDDAVDIGFIEIV